MQAVGSPRATGSRNRRRSTAGGRRSTVGRNMASAVMAVLNTAGRGDRTVGMDLGRQYLRVIGEVFRRLDKQGHGVLGQIQLQQLWRAVLPGMHENDLLRLADEIFQDLDPNHDGHVSWPEIETYFLGGSEATTDVDRMIDDQVMQRKPGLRELTWAVLEVDAPRFADEPPWLPVAKQLALLVSNLAILTSIANFIIESLPRYYKEAGTDEDWGSFFVITEACCIAVFTVEFMLRVLFCPSLKGYWLNFFTWVDVLAILPFYVGVILGSNPSGGLVVLRVLRLLRLLRMLKLGRQFEAVHVLVIAIGRTIWPLLVSMIGVNAVAVTLFGSLIVTAERHQAHFDHAEKAWRRDHDSYYIDKGQEIEFQSIPESMWWAWVTLTTVGYGDMSPKTGPGKAVAAIAMCCGLVLMAFPLTLLASAFAETTEELTAKKRLRTRGERFKVTLAKYGLSPNASSDTIQASVERAVRPQAFGLPTSPRSATLAEDAWFPEFGSPRRQLVERTMSGLGVQVPAGEGRVSPRNGLLPGLPALDVKTDTSQDRVGVAQLGLRMDKQEQALSAVTKQLSVVLAALERMEQQQQQRDPPHQPPAKGSIPQLITPEEAGDSDSV